MTFKEHDIVYLLIDIPAEGLKKGDHGTIVHTYPAIGFYEVEFITANSQNIVMPVTHRDLTKLKP